MSQAVEDFLSIVQSHSSLPYLFVGSGISQRYMGTPTWKGLLDHFATVAGRSLNYYAASANQDLTLAASLIADDFYQKWWDDERYEVSREQYRDTLTTRESPLKIEVAEYLKSFAISTDDAVMKEELEHLRKAVVDGIITTNYDHLLSQLFPDFRMFVGQHELLFSNFTGLAEIYQIHGGCSQPDSIVLTHEGYRDYRQKNPYLVSKLLTIFVEHPVIFLGYSLTDTNIQEMISALVNVMDEDQMEKLGQRMLFVTWDRHGNDPVFRNTHQMVKNVSIPLVHLSVPDFVELFEGLASLNRRFPVKLLSKLREHVYNLVRDDDPVGKLAVLDLEQIDSYDEVEYAVGIGLHEKLKSLGVIGLERIDLLDDVLNGGSQWNTDQIVLQALPRLSKGNTYLPVHKYLSNSGFDFASGQIQGGLPVATDIKDKATWTADCFRTDETRNRRRAERHNYSFDELRNEESLNNQLLAAACIPGDRIDLEAMRQFLLSCRDEANAQSGVRSSWAKLVCLYDLLKYGQPHVGNDDGPESLSGE